MEPRVYLRPVRRADGPELVAANRASVDLQEPWVSPCRDEAAFEAYLASCDGERRVSFLARDRESDALVGVVSLSSLIRGALECAFLGYYGVVGGVGRGLMTEALALAVTAAFEDLELHRLEANIQPGNGRSIALVRRLGFRKEGFSPRYLKLGGAWRDHERWAILSEEWSERPAALRFE